MLPINNQDTPREVNNFYATVLPQKLQVTSFPAQGFRKKKKTNSTLAVFKKHLVPFRDAEKLLIFCILPSSVVSSDHLSQPSSTSSCVVKPAAFNRNSSRQCKRYHKPLTTEENLPPSARAMLTSLYTQY